MANRYPAFCKTGARLWAFLLCFTLFSTEVCAQYIRHYSAHQFLRAENIYQISRDRAGFLWFCTNKGLIRYDGQSMRHYTRNSGLPDEMVFNVYEDAARRLWVFCNNGRYCYIKGDSVFHESNEPFLAKLPKPGGFITCMAQSADSTLWFGFSSRSIMRTQHQRLLSLENYPGGWSTIEISATSLRYKPELEQTYLSTDGQQQVIADTFGIRVYREGFLKKAIYERAFTVQNIHDVFLDAALMFVCTANGLWVIDLSRPGWRLHLLEKEKVTSCDRDISGNYWIATLGGGVFQLHRELERIRPLPALTGQELFPLSNGRVLYLKDNAVFELQDLNAQISSTRILGGVPGHFSPLFLDLHLALLFNTWGYYTKVINRATGNSQKTLLYIKRLYSDSSNRYFGYHNHSAYYARIKAGQFVVDDTLTYTDRIIASCQEDRSSAALFISGTYLLKANIGARKTDTVFRDSLLATATDLVCKQGRLYISLGDSRVASLYPITPNGRLSLIYPGFPIRKFVPLSKERYLLQSERQDYIISGNQSKYALQPISYPFSAAQYEEINQIGSQFLVRLEGKYYSFDSGLLNTAQTPAQVYLKQLLVNGKEYYGTDITIPNVRKLDVQLSIGILDFSAKLQSLRYRLRGPQEGDWQQTNATELAFALARPGVYEIEIMPDAKGTAVKPLTISIRAEAPFYYTGYFLVLLAVTFLAVCIWIAYSILQRRRKQFDRELNYLKLEHKAINALLNPHFVFNSINNIQGLINKSDKAGAADFLAVLSRLIRQNLENLQFNLIPLENELSLIQRYITLQNLRFDNRIDLAVRIRHESLRNMYIPPLLLHTFVENAIIHGFRNREVAFEISIDISMLDGQYALIRVDDNGIGIDSGKKQTDVSQSSMGISFNRKRLNRLSDFYKLQQSIDIQDRIAEGNQGTSVRIKLYAGLEQLLEEKRALAN